MTSAEATIAANASGPPEAADACAAPVRRLRLTVDRQPCCAVRAQLPLHLASYRVHQRRRARVRQVFCAKAEPAAGARVSRARFSACAARALLAAAALRAPAGRPSPAWRRTPRRRPPARANSARSAPRQAPGRSEQPQRLRRRRPRDAAQMCAAAARSEPTGSGDAEMWRSLYTVRTRGVNCRRSSAHEAVRGGVRRACNPTARAGAAAAERGCVQRLTGRHAAWSNTGVGARLGLVARRPRRLHRGPSCCRGAVAGGV
jgi:hypothetical protein